MVTSAKNLVRWIDFGGSIDEICGFVDEVEMTADTAEIYQLKQKTIDETLSWTPGSRRLISHLGDAIHNRNLAVSLLNALNFDTSLVRRIKS